MGILGIVGWPVLDRIGPVSPHGLGIAVGYLAGSWFMLREARKRGIDEDHVGTILLWALVGAIVGARVFYVLGHLEDFESFGEMLRIWEGGISLIGGIAGAVIFGYPVMRRYGYRFLQVMDSASIGLAFGIFIGRIGDLVIGDHLGKPTNFLLGWAYRGGELPGPWTQSAPGQWTAQLSDGLVQTLSRDGAQLVDISGGGAGANIVATGAGVHQTALYDFFIALGLFLLLRWLNRRPRREGVLILTFATLYGLGRVITDFLRIDKTYFDTFTGSQLTSIAVILLSLFTLWRFSRNPISGEEADEGEPEADLATESDGAEAPARSTTFRPPKEPGPSSPPDAED